MKYGIYYAYWEKEWNGDYKYYIDKISKLGFDILEISCGAFSDYYTKDQELIDIGKYAEEKGVTLTAGMDLILMKACHLQNPIRRNKQSVFGKRRSGN